MLNISNQKIKSLLDVSFCEGITHLYCSKNDLTNLQGCPPGIKYIDCSYNNLVSLEGCPAGLSFLDCRNNFNLLSIHGCSNKTKIKHDIRINDNDILRLHKCNICNDKEIVYNCRRKVNEKIHVKDNIIKGLHKFRSVYHASLIQRCWKRYWSKRNHSARIIQKQWNRYWMVPNKNTGKCRYIIKACDQLF